MHRPAATFAFLALGCTFAPAQHQIATDALTPREQAVQLLDRFAFGARPGDVERVIAEGPEAWLTQQLSPNAIPDLALDKRLQDYPTLAPHSGASAADLSRPQHRDAGRRG